MVDLCEMGVRLFAARRHIQCQSHGNNPGDPLFGGVIHSELCCVLRCGAGSPARTVAQCSEVFALGRSGTGEESVNMSPSCC